MRTVELLRALWSVLQQYPAESIVLLNTLVLTVSLARGLFTGRKMANLTQFVLAFLAFTAGGLYAYRWWATDQGARWIAPGYLLFGAFWLTVGLLRYRKEHPHKPSPAPAQRTPAGKS
jgi:hypothetical protein